MLSVEPFLPAVLGHAVRVKKSGRIWRTPRSKRAGVVRNVCQALKKSYGLPRFGNPSRPLDDLVYIVLSNKTGPTVARAVFRRLKTKFKSWDRVADASLASIIGILRPAGLARVKARHLRASLRRIRDRFGTCSLRSLAGAELEAVQSYLCSLPGVSEKVAKCVMMYTLGLDVLPVDAHVHRIASRLGWTSRKRADQCHAELESLITPRNRFAFHVGCVAHGRAVCRPLSPRCGDCTLQKHCRHARKQ